MTVFFSHTYNLMALEPNPPCQHSLWKETGVPGGRRKPTTFGRALTILFSHEDWVRVHIEMNLAGFRNQSLIGFRTRNLSGGERRVV